MRHSLIESLVIGCSIALGVLLVHTLTEGASALAQLLVLLIAGVVLFCVQLVLVLALGRMRGAAHPPEQQEAPQQPSRPLHGRRRNPFVRELTHDWMGLEDHATERDPSGPLAPDALDDELWGDPPQAPVRKAVAKAVAKKVDD